MHNISSLPPKSSKSDAQNDAQNDAIFTLASDRAIMAVLGVWGVQQQSETHLLKYRRFTRDRFACFVQKKKKTHTHLHTHRPNTKSTNFYHFTLHFVDRILVDFFFVGVCVFG